MTCPDPSPRSLVAARVGRAVDGLRLRGEPGTAGWLRLMLALTREDDTELLAIVGRYAAHVEALAAVDTTGHVPPVSRRG